MNPAVAVLERMEEDKSVGHGSGVDHGRYVARFHPLVGGEQAFHQAGQVFRFRTGEMDSLLLPGDRLADIVLARAVIGFMESWIDNAVLQIDQPRFLAEIFAVGRLQQGNETLDARRVGLRCSISKDDFVSLQ